MLEQAVPQIVCAWIWNYVYLINKKAGKAHCEGCHRKVQWFLQLTAKSEECNWWMSMAYKAAQRRALNQKDYLKQWGGGHRESEGEIWPQKQKPGRESPVCLWFFFFFKKKPHLHVFSRLRKFDFLIWMAIVFRVIGLQSEAILW